MNIMIKASTGWSLSKVLMIAAFALTLTACGGGGGGSSSVLARVKALVATGSAADLETAMALANDTCDTVSASECEALMDALVVV